MATGMQIKYGGISHYCLKYAMTFDSRGPSTPEDVKRLFGHKFDRISKITESMETLVRYGLLRKYPNGYRITEAGRDQLRKMARPTNGRNDD